MKHTLKDWKRFKGLFYYVGPVPECELTPVGQKTLRVVFQNGKSLEIRAVNGALFISGQAPFQIGTIAPNSYKIFPVSVGAGFQVEQQVEKKKGTGYFSHLKG